MLSLSFLIGTCLISQLSPLFSLYAPALILLFLTKVWLSLTLTLSHLTIGYSGQTQLRSLSFWQERLWRTCQLLSGTDTTLSFSAGSICSSFSDEACAILQVICWSRQHQQVCHFSSMLCESCSLLHLSFNRNFSGKSSWNCFVFLPVLSGYNGFPDTCFSPETARLMSWPDEERFACPL